MLHVNGTNTWLMHLALTNCGPREVLVKLRVNAATQSPPGEYSRLQDWNGQTKYRVRSHHATNILLSASGVGQAHDRVAFLCVLDWEDAEPATEANRESGTVEYQSGVIEDLWFLRYGITNFANTGLPPMAIRVKEQ